jgi:hypothetical protein
VQQCFVTINRAIVSSKRLLAALKKLETCATPKRWLHHSFETKPEMIRRTARAAEIHAIQRSTFID